MINNYSDGDKGNAWQRVHVTDGAGNNNLRDQTDMLRKTVCGQGDMTATRGWRTK